MRLMRKDMILTSTTVAPRVEAKGKAVATKRESPEYQNQ